MKAGGGVVLWIVDDGWEKGKPRKSTCCESKPEAPPLIQAEPFFKHADHGHQ
jgi:hypothetical protein